MRTLAMLLAGGQGSRLSILSQRRAKPAVPFGGAYRIIDFTLSNVMHAEIPYVGILTQYKPYSLMEHIGSGEWWGFMGRGRMARVLPPYTGEDDSDWYAGTADAIWQNRNFVARFDPDVVFVLSGDHIYNMNLREMLQLHSERRADVTIAMQAVPWEDTSRFGLAELAEDGRVLRFQEKPKSNPISNLASLGIYVFETDVLLKRLQDDAADEDSFHDFGKNIIPAMLAQDRVFGYVFDGYWRDVGTIQSFWDANMEALSPESSLDFFRWDVRSNYFDPRLHNEVPARLGSGCKVQSSYIPRGCIIEGEVVDSVLFPGVQIGKGARVQGSILMNNTTIGEGSVVERAILDKNCLIGRDCAVGVGENLKNIKHPDLLDTGITVLGKGVELPRSTKVGRNVLVFPEVRPEDLTTNDIKSGETVSKS